MFLTDFGTMKNIGNDSFMKRYQSHDMHYYLVNMNDLFSEMLNLTDISSRDKARNQEAIMSAVTHSLLRGYFKPESKASPEFESFLNNIAYPLSKLIDRYLRLEFESAMENVLNKLYTGPTVVFHKR